MPRPRLGSSRKQSYGISLDAESAMCLADIGNGSVSAGVNWLIDEVIRRDPRGALAAVASAREAYRKQMADALAAKIVAQETAEREKAKKKAARGPSRAQREFEETVAHYMAINDKLYAEGKPLYNMGHMSIRRELVAAVYAAARAKYGWETGPRPAGVGGSGDPQPVQTLDAAKVGRDSADISVLPEERDAAEPEITQQLDLRPQDSPPSVDISSSATVAHDPVDRTQSYPPPPPQDPPAWAGFDPNAPLSDTVDTSSSDLADRAWSEMTDAPTEVAAAEVAAEVPDVVLSDSDLQKSNTPDVQEPEF